MLFSGHSRHLRCGGCGWEYSDAKPTSIIPMLAVIGVATTQWSFVLTPVLGRTILRVPAAVLLTILSIVAVFAVVDLATRLYLSKCRSCGGELTAVGGGFYDGFVPHPIELLVYAWTVVLPIIIRGIT